MSSINLTRVEAAARAENLTVHHYDIALDLTTSEETFPSVTTVTFAAARDCSTFLDVRAKTIRSVVLDGVDITSEAVTFTADGVYDEAAGLQLKDLSAGEHTLTVDVEAVYSRTGQGLHRYVDPADKKTYLYTQFETADAKRMFACFDQPDLKATYALSVITPTEWKVIGNAPQQVSTSGQVATHRSRIEYPLSTYLVAICVGPYHEVRDTWSGELKHWPETPADQPTQVTVPLGIYCRASLAKHLDHERLFRETKQGFDFYHENFGVAYPFGKYDQIFVPEFNMGAMENAGCVTHRDEYVFTSRVTGRIYERRAETILHEMAHMWFGDLVTMRWWNDLWLNESFATWASVICQSEATEYSDAWVTFANTEKSWAYQQDQLPSTHPISTDASDIETVEQNFDGITYAKGASVLKQLQAYVGRDAFFAGVRRHFAKHAMGNATFADLLASLEEASGRDLSQWAAQWLQTTGITTLSPTFTVAEDGTYASFAVEQSGAEPGAGECRTHRICVGLYRRNPETGKVEATASVGTDVSGESTPVPDLVGTPKADLVLVNDQDLTYCLSELDEDSLAFVIDAIGDITDPLARTLCWSATWQMTRSGRMRARDFLTLVARGIAAEDQISVQEMLLMQAQLALTQYADPQWAASTGRTLLADLLIAQAADAEGGSDQQLAFVKSLLRLQLTEASTPVAQAIVDAPLGVIEDHPVLAGITVDHELTWQALIALIAAGEVDDAAAAIAAQRDADPSGSGQNFAWEAQAAIPTREGKAAVFDAVTEKGCALSNLAIRHKIAGLMHDGSADLIAPLAARYFEIAPAVWEYHSSEMALATLSGVYPMMDITDEGLARADELLAGDIPAGLRRVVEENRDRVARALRNRAVDAGK